MVPGIPDSFCVAFMTGEWFSGGVSKAAETQQLYEVVKDRMNRPHPEPLNLSTRPLPDGAKADVVIETSGSASGSPHLVALSWAALRASAERTIEFLGTPGRWWLQLPTNRIAGFQVLVRSALMGIEPSLSPLDCQYTAVVPTQLQNRDLAGMRAILVGGAASPVLPVGLPCIRTYGMTETAGGCVYDGRPLRDVQVRISDGRVLLSGPMLMDGYLDAPSPLETLKGRTWLTTGDLGIFNNDTLEILGRADDVIISGGVNVVPEIVRGKILTRRPDLQVEVLGIDDATWGQAVCAAVVGNVEPEEVRGPDGGADAPRIVVTLPALPQLPGGKVDKQQLRREVEAAIGAGRAWRR